MQLLFEISQWWHNSKSSMWCSQRQEMRLRFGDLHGSVINYVIPSLLLQLRRAQVLYRGLRQITADFLSLQYGQCNIGGLGAAQYTDVLGVKQYIFLKSLVPIYSVGLVDSIYLQLYKVFYYNTNFFYKGRCQEYSFRLDKLPIPYIKLQA